MSNALAMFCCNLGATAMSNLKFSNRIYYSIFDSFPNPYQLALPTIEACPFEDIYCDTLYGILLLLYHLFQSLILS